jgi:hypothetical protein
MENAWPDSEKKVLDYPVKPGNDIQNNQDGSLYLTKTANDRN